MEKEPEVDLEQAYEKIKEEQPYPWEGQCQECGKKMVTELHAGYKPHKNDFINLYRPAYCPDCNEGMDELIVKIIAAADQQGEIHPRNRKGKMK